MTGHIMVPLDGSEKDGRALAVASALAHLSGAGIHLVHILRGDSDDADLAARTSAEEQLVATTRQLAANGHKSITSVVIHGRDVAEALIRTATADGALVVVMGTRAADTVRRAVVGSVADRVMRESPRPVVLVPPGAAFMAGKRMRLGRVLVPLDGSELAEKALEFLLRLPQARELEYVLLQVVPPTTVNPQGPEIQAVDFTPPSVVDAERRLQAIAARIRESHVTVVEVAVVEGADVATAIASAVRDCFVEMIAMSTRGAGGLRRLVFGSVAEGVVRTSEVPLLLLTPAMLETDS